VSNTKQIEDAIVSKYHQGKCDHNGNTLPKEQWGMAGKGSHFIAGGLVGGIGENRLNIWPRDENGNLIED
jgi:hypothetical protein